MNDTRARTGIDGFLVALVAIPATLFGVAIVWAYDVDPFPFGFLRAAGTFVLLGAVWLHAFRWAKPKRQTGNQVVWDAASGAFTGATLCLYPLVAVGEARPFALSSFPLVIAVFALGSAVTVPFRKRPQIASD